MKIKINHDYFSLNNKVENVLSFIRQGNIFSHIMDRIIWNYFPQFFITPPFPTHLEIETSSTCQMSCPMCKTTEMRRRGVKFQGFMDMELYKKIIDECANSTLYSIKLSWRGEPLLNPRLVEMITYAKKRGIKDVAFLTNGERLTPKLTEDLVNAGLDWISISFDGMGDTYNKIRKPAIFEETLEKIRYIRAYRETQRRKKPLIRVQSVHSAIMGQEQEFLNLWKGVAERVNFISDQKRSIDHKEYRHDPKFICPSPWQRACITWDGKVVQCFGDYMEGNILGYIHEKSIKKIWRGKPFTELRGLMRKGKRLKTMPCRTCSDGGILEEEEITVGDRKVKAARYIHQAVNVREMIKNKPRVSCDKKL